MHSAVCFPWHDFKTSETNLSRANTGESSAVGAAWALLLECARPNPDTQRLTELLGGSVDWPVLFSLAEEHGTLGLVSIRLRDCGESVVPPETREKLRDWHRAQMLSTLSLTAEMFRLLDRFAACGIEMLVIKGPVLSARCYGDPGLRQYGDLDLIVRDEDILRSTELMIDFGYESRVPPAAIRAKKTPGEYAFRQPSTKLLAEFHTDRTFRYYPRPLPLETLFARQARVLMDGREVPALALEDELVLICIHGAKHFWGRLMWIADVAALVARQALDWDKAASAAQEVGAERMLRVGLRLVTELAGAQLPERIAAAVQTDHGAARLSRQIAQWLPVAGYEPPGILKRATFRMRMRGGLLSGPAYLLRLSVSPTEEDWAEGAEEKHSSFHEAARRPFRLARKYSRDGKA